jgi:hypothetical protein
VSGRRLAASAAVLLLAACGPTPPWPQPPELPLDLRASLSTTEVLLFEPVVLTVDFFRRNGVEAAFEPAVPPGFFGDVLPMPERAFGGGSWQRTMMLLRPQPPGELVVAPFTVQGRDGEATVNATSAELRLQVRSLLGDQAGEFEDPGPLRSPPGRYHLLWAIPPAVLGAAGLLWWWLRRSPRPVPPAPLPTPLQLTLAALARLRAALPRTAAEIPPFYVDVAQVLRVWLESCFRVPATERTTEEFLAELEQGNLLTAAQRAALRQFLDQCDLVKFAAVLPESAVHERTLQTAEDLVQATARPESAP